MAGLAQLCLFSGFATTTRAYLYARLPRSGDTSSGCRLTGEVRGPFCRHAETLPTTYRLEDTGSGPTILARALVVDPCCWSPQLPMLYRVRVQLVANDKVVATAEFTTGIRSLGVVGRSLAIEGRRFVIRGCSVRSAAPTDLRHWREVSAAMLIDEPDVAVCQEAAEEGVLLIARFTRFAGQFRDRITALAPWPSFAVAVVDGDEAEAQVVREAAPNVLLAARRTSATASLSELMFWSAHDDVPAAEVAACTCPVLACRPLPRAVPLETARREVDRWQRDLAPALDLAGYLV